ncbi:P-loop containing nucleoside triphosphate hydrolase protein [Protomyces lactucae-debilis]|uniref:Cell division control protein n=1 Tax=Protomyces lactucae-debilis TaxID=2754530 RepID=A0A1Y2F7N9_PROLT|nr:P-loop containing nucleoside triphosphate hydrolase protein [Protomyces lactucae-debilis]ORY79908.1 P-loop containing nucleoside triphosphate hydrolase protein [Protomyces lactucae-debilis]
MSSLGKRTRRVAAADPVTPSKRRIIQLLTPDTTPTKPSPSRIASLKQRSTPSSVGSPYSPTKSILRRNAVTPVVGREEESQALQAFLEDPEQPLLYICGPPGTGKSATVSQYTQTLPVANSQRVFINCVSLKRPDEVYATILASIDPTAACATASAARKRLTAYTKLSTSHQLILILDEMDYLSSSSLDTLYALFELANGKHVKIIGIANALNLTDTVLPHLQATGIQPTILRFKPYTPAEITRILTARVNAIANPAQTLVDPPALLLLGRKVANATGDIRKALDILRRAVELVEVEHRSILTEMDTNAPSTLLPKVTLKHVAQAAAQALTAGMATSDHLRKLSLHELACLCTLASQKTNTIAETYEAYVRLCKRDKMTTALVRTEFTNICEALVDRGMLAIPRGKVGSARMMRQGSGQGQHGQESRPIVLAVSEMEVLNAIGDLGVLRRFFE